MSSRIDNLVIEGGGTGSVEVLDTLDSTSTIAALSANKGRELKETIDGFGEASTKDVTDVISENSQELITSGAVYTAVSNLENINSNVADAFSTLGMSEESKTDGYEIALAKSTNTAEKTKVKVPVYDTQTPSKTPVGLVDETFVNNMGIMMDGKIETALEGFNPEGEGSNVTIVQETGTSTTDVMSQKAVTDAIVDEKDRAEEAEKVLSDKIGSWVANDYGDTITENLATINKAFEDSVPDEVPTEGSQSTVMSGGVYQAIAAEKKRTDDAIIASKDEIITNRGKDYVILKENVSFAEQVTKANTIYEIGYDFDLNEAEVTIPECCVLKFNGGSIKNGSLIFNYTILEGTIEFDEIISIDGKVKNDTIESDNYGFVTDKEKLSFLFNQIRDNVTIIINGIYNVSYNDLVFTPESKTFKSGRTTKTYSWKKFDTVNNLKLVGNAVINFTNCPTTVYREVLYFSNGLNNSTIQLSATGDVNFYKVDNDYGLNLIKVMGDSNGNHIALTCDRLSIPFYFGDYYGNDGLTGLINSDITVVNSTDEETNVGNKYGARIHYARNCNIFIKNSYGHRGLYLGGGISHCKIRTECKYMDTSAAVMIGNTYVNDRIQGANDLYIETHDTGTKGDNSIVPARVYINSHGGNIDNGISARDYSVIYDNIEIVATYSAETSSTTGIMPFIIHDQGTMDTGRNLVPKDIKKIKCTLILTDGAIVPSTGSIVLNVYSAYDGRYDDIDLYYRIINNSSRSDIYASGAFGVNNNHKITIHSDVRVTPYMFRQSLPKSDWLITNDQYDGSYRLIFKDTPLYLPDYTQTQWETITGRNEAIPEYIIVEGKKAVNGTSRVPQYNKNLTLFKSRGTTAERPAARNGDRYYDTTIQKFIYWDSARGGWINADGYAAGNRSGARRAELTDSLTGLDTGLQFYDTSLGKLVIWNGDWWEDINGNEVTDSGNE